MYNMQDFHEITVKLPDLHVPILKLNLQLMSGIGRNAELLYKNNSS